MPARLEYKYLVPNLWLDALQTYLQPYVELDPYAKNCENGEYVVRSIYLDTPGFECYHTKLDGLRCVRNIGSGVISFSGAGTNIPPYQDVFDQYCRKCQPINVKSSEAHQTRNYRSRFN